MSGVLSVPSLVITGNSGITLPTTYTAAPTTSQLGGASVRYTWTAVNSFAYTNTNLASFIVGQGSYLIIYRVALHNATASVEENFIFFKDIQRHGILRWCTFIGWII